MLRLLADAWQGIGKANWSTTATGALSTAGAERGREGQADAR